MKLTKNEVHIWSIDLSTAAAWLQQPESCLNKDEWIRANQYKLEKPKVQYINTRYALRTILSHYTHVSPQSLAFEYNSYGKPHLLAPFEKIAFNLSHSEKWLIIALTFDHLIGVDIEKMLPRSDLSLAKRFFSPNEYQALLSYDYQSRTQLFYILWSRKEAVIKAVGKGLNIPLNSFSLHPVLTPESIKIENDDWTVMSLSIDSDYQAAVASNQLIQSIRYWNFFDHI